MGESVIDCSMISAMPNITFTIKDKAYVLTPEQVAFLLLSVYVLTPSTRDTSTCTSVVSNLNITPHFSHMSFSEFESN